MVGAWSGFRRARRRDGQAVLEFALILPVFMLLVFGAVEFGRAYFTLHVTTSAARDGARRGSLPNQTLAEVEDTVDGFFEAAGYPHNWETHVTVTDASGHERTDPDPVAAALPGDRVQVTVIYNFHVQVGNLLPGFSGVVPLRGQCTFRHE